MLTEREYKIAAGVLAGRPPSKIADEMGLARPTISNALRAVSRKLPTMGQVIAEARAFHRQHAELRPA